MSEETIKEMMEAYVANYITRFKKVAGKAYVDGMLDAMKYIKEKIAEL